MKEVDPQKFFVWLLITLGAVLFLTVSALSASPANDLPPRPETPTPDALSPTPAPPTPIVYAPGGYVVLHVPEGNASYWTVVQWVDPLGTWHDVTGWRGNLDDGDGNMKIWWVAPEDFGKGALRWQVFDGPDGRLLATSDPFFLPAYSIDEVKVQLNLKP
jgi:hypothetical protein